MIHVYVLQSTIDSTRHYTGVTKNLLGRLHEHNNGHCAHTKKYIPWKMIISIAFEYKNKAYAFEKYLKSGSGRAFAKKHF